MSKKPNPWMPYRQRIAIGKFDLIVGELFDKSPLEVAIRRTLRKGVEVWIKEDGIVAIMFSHTSVLVDLPKSAKTFLKNYPKVKKRVQFNINLPEIFKRKANEKPGTYTPLQRNG